MTPTVQTIDVLVKPITRECITLLKAGQEPGFVKHYFALHDAPPEHGKGYTQYYWAPDDSVWVSWGELNRLKALARGKRKPFPAKVTIVPSVPNLWSHASETFTHWARELVQAEFLEEMRQAKEEIRQAAARQ
jgi:hypothetical protein